ncbi:RNA pseudouridine synthase 5 isoform X3 [Amborella trichopoda]|uniref:RNA pseudouridine synthase 5 isoform X3 n=1 Tax=Amborella trichopoda TaxID=13333 RepID=UPI0009C16141|nr:RNA pseudouridine synthase 5 isoform X3 [Amborella trichopoda]|eukprot:XP_020526690.1 RNA pseudouridine synthase 5 isoform X3 [Amborella trichopoda]
MLREIFPPFANFRGSALFCLFMATHSYDTVRERFGHPWPELNDGIVYSDTIKSNNPAALTLIGFYSSKYIDSAPLEGWLQRIRNEQIKIDNKVVTNPDTLLSIGSNLLYHRIPWKELDAPYMLDVLFEDSDMVAVNKPSGLQVLPGGLFQQRTVLSQLQWRTYGPYCSSQTLRLTSSSQVTHPIPVHRLGRGTSGILLCAKTVHAKVHLAACFADATSLATKNRQSSEELHIRRISKTYRALATGILEKDEVLVKQPIGLMRYSGVASGIYVASSSGKPAESRVKVLQRDFRMNCTLVQVEIYTGRPHQIRIHLSFIGHPLLGDPLYISSGGPKCFESESSVDIIGFKGFAQDGGHLRPSKPVPGDCGYHLHAHQLVLYHPTAYENGVQVIEIIAPLPRILQSEEERDQYTETLMEIQTTDASNSL